MYDEQELTYQEFYERVEYHLEDKFGRETPEDIRPLFEKGMTVEE